jgi:hypothetical protein
MRPSNKTDADGLAVAVVLTLELVKIALVLVRRNHVVRIIINETRRTFTGPFFWHEGEGGVQKAFFCLPLSSHCRVAPPNVL